MIPCYPKHSFIASGNFYITNQRYGLPLELKEEKYSYKVKVEGGQVFMHMYSLHSIYLQYTR